ncbi:OmpA family protein [Zhouia sp. PK063]|uniref:OmpA family protein n=1 Tax=Zhouia sp. PK063 TaxID=3373602 RepID=UPI00378F0BCB
MKKSLFLLGALSFAFLTKAQAQETEMTTTSQDTMMSSDDYHAYDHWSLEIQGGFNHPFRAMSGGYYTSRVSPYTLGLGVRYMFNEYIGAKLGFMYDSFKEDDNSMPFDSKQYSFTLEGVANLGRVMHFESWTHSLNLLGHAGLGWATINADAAPDNDGVVTMVAGLTGELKLGKSVALTGDISGVGNTAQSINFDGHGNTAGLSVIQGMNLRGTVGLTFYLGKAEEHADWYVPESLESKVMSLDGRVTAIEDKMKDSDQDGVADYLDQEPNTVSGVAVDTKGRAVDNNGNGIPDDLESALDARYAMKGEANGDGDAIAKLLNDGYVSVFFDFGSSKVKEEETPAINYIITYLRNNAGTSATLQGYADEIGSESYNQSLSEKRAQHVKDVLVAAGIDESRLSVQGQGEDTSVDKSSSKARNTVRRVIVKLN